MNSKYDRNLEDIERARMEERFWSDPFSLAQFRQFQQPIQNLQNPYMQQLSPYTAFQLNPQIPQFHPLFNPMIHYGQSYWQQPYEPSVQQGQLRPTSRAFERPPKNYKRSDELIRDEICKRLTLTPEFDATDIEVIVKDGEVTLRGFVDDRFAKRLVEDITECTFGVRDVLNEVRVGSQELIGATKGKEK